jgi:hypothetical protein
MPLSSIFTATARFAGRVGNQAAVSLVASAAAAACLALPGFMSGPASPPEPAVVASEPSGWASPVSPDGKIRERHQDATGGEGLVQALTGRGLATPAALLMPMNLGWAQLASEEPASVRTAIEPTASVIRTATVLPPRRPAALAERARPAADPVPPSEPLQLAGAVTGVDTPDTPRPPATILGRVVPAPVGYLGGTVSGAVGLVGAAGSWTVARAASLVPRL